MIEAVAAVAETLEGTAEMVEAAGEMVGETPDMVSSLAESGDIHAPDIDSPDINSGGDNKLTKGEDPYKIEGSNRDIPSKLDVDGLNNVRPKEFVPDIDSPDLDGVKESANQDAHDNSSTTDGNQSEDSEGSPKRVKCINEKYAGQNHPDTGVPYVEKTVTDAEGNEVNGVFPQFDSKFDVQLPEDLYQASDDKQFAECNKQLKDKCLSDPEFAKQFNERQLDDIMNGRTPYGYVWHHNEELGKMQLVDYDIHDGTRHTGGKSIWGGGRENR